MFRIEYASQSKKFLKNSDKNTAERIINKLEQIRENPFHFLEHYEGEYYKLRIGDYRALLDIDFEKKLITVQVLDKRGRIYKR